MTGGRNNDKNPTTGRTRIKIQGTTTAVLITNERESTTSEILATEETNCNRGRPCKRFNQNYNESSPTRRHEGAQTYEVSREKSQRDGLNPQADAYKPNMNSARPAHHTENTGRDTSEN
jgi:hypothetical protein